MTTKPVRGSYRGSMTQAIMDLHHAGTPVRQIAGALKVSTQHVYRTLHRHGYRANPPDNR